MKYAIIDLETTGLKPDYHEIIEISIIIIDEFLQEKNRFITTMKPNHFTRIDPKALEINKVDIQDMLSFPTDTQVRGKFLTWKQEILGDEKLIPIGHNITFDLMFLKNFLRYHFDELFHYKKIDTKILIDSLKLLKMFPDNISSSLPELTKALQIKHDAHKAYGDCKAVIKVLNWFKNNLTLHLDDILKD